MRSPTLLLGLAACLASGAVASEGHGARHHRLAQRAQQARNATAPTPTVAPKRAAACAASYKPSTSVTTIKGTGTLPKATARVTRCVGSRDCGRADRRRSGTQLKLGSKTFKAVGPNIYWLGLDENVGIAYPSKQRVREAMAITVAMGGTVIRSQTLGVSTGRSLSLEPSLDNFNDAAFDSIDYAIYAAKLYGLRVIVPLTDQYQYYHGGKCDFVKWVGASTSNNCNSFYTDSRAIAAFKRYIKYLITHKSPYTGNSMANEPAVLAFETGNEMGAYMNQQGSPPASWTRNIAQYIKSLSKALVIDGSDGLFDPDGSKIDGVGVSEIDILSDHQYPASTSLLNKDYSAAKAANKNLLIGEYDWTSSGIGSWVKAVESATYTGDLLWSVFGHDDQCCAFVQHNDGYSLYYPNGNSASLQKNNILPIVQHWYRMSGRTVPKALPAVLCPQPAI